MWARAGETPRKSASLVDKLLRVRGSHISGLSQRTDLCLGGRGPSFAGSSSAPDRSPVRPTVRTDHDLVERADDKAGGRAEQSSPLAECEKVPVLRSVCQRGNPGLATGQVSAAQPLSGVHLCVA